MPGSRRLVVILTLLLPAASARADFKKAYFGATRPGSFAKMRSTDEKGAVNEYTYSRLSDQGGEPWIEMKYEATSGQFKGTMSVTGCLLPASFPLDRDAIDFQAHARRCAAYATGSPVTEYAKDTMKAIASGVINYATISTFKGSEVLDGKSCDRYGYVFKTNYGTTQATMTGDLWMSDSVPFGIVKEASVTRDSSGKVLYKFDTRLVASGGDGARSGLKGWSWGGATSSSSTASVRPERSGRSPRDEDTAPDVPARPSTSLAEAFASGTLAIRCVVLPSGKDGPRLRLHLSNRGTAPYALSLTRTPMTLTVGAPLETLTVSADADRVVELVPGKAPVMVEVSQSGKRRATRGEFTVGMFESRPFLQGTVDVGSAKAE